jgi:hypothetical protein
MANETRFVTPSRKTIGDVAVDGLLAGMAAGLVMAVWLLLAGWIGGEGPAVTLGRFDPGGGSSPLAGALMHLAVAGIYGVVFAIIARVLAGRRIDVKRFLWLLGAAYGLGLWLVARLVVLPGLSPALTEVPTISFVLAHGLYGLTLGYLLSRHQNG